MAAIVPFRAWRYDPSRVPVLSKVVTQPYDKITPAMREGYYAASPHNICRVILEKDADYAKAAGTLSGWMREGVLRQDERPSIYPYFQTYRTPDGQERTRKAFIAGAVLEPLGSRVRAHEKTLAGPKADRLNLLRACQASCELIFLLYDDPKGELNRLLDEAARRQEAKDGNTHRVWAMDDRSGSGASGDPAALLLPDRGCHRYETALNYRRKILCTAIGGLRRPGTRGSHPQPTGPCIR